MAALAGGWEAWKQAGLFVETPAAPTKQASDTGDDSQAGRGAQARGRLMPPAGLKCDRNDLTLYDGRVIAYRRRTGSTFLRIRTNFDTTEEVTIRHPRTDDPSKFYLLNGEPFTRADWRRIEKRRKILLTGMRANVWVCRDNASVQPVVDWRPDDTGDYPRSR